MDGPSRSQLPRVLVHLFRGVIYRDQDAARWRDLVGLQAAARDYVRVLGLELVIDEAEGYAFLRQLAPPTPAPRGTQIPQRPTRQSPCRG